MGKDRDIGSWIRGLISQGNAAAADRIIIRNEEDHLSYEFQQTRQTIFQSTTVGIALQDISHWLESRVPYPTGDLIGFYGVSVGDQLCTFRTVSTSRLRGGETLSLSDFGRKPLPASWKELFGRGPVEPDWEELKGLKKGLLIVAAPNERQLRTAVGCVMSRFDAGYYGFLSEASPFAAIADEARNNVAVLGLVACDPVEALLRFRGKAYQSLIASIGSVLCMGFVPQVCEACARPTSVPQHILHQIPAPLRPTSLESYRVGRGCDNCEQVGASRSIVVSSFVPIEPETRSIIFSGDAIQLVRDVHSKGGVPLVENLVKLASSGLTTFEAMELFTRTLSPAFDRWYGSRGGEDTGDWVSEDQNPLASVELENPSKDDGFVLIVEDDEDQRKILRAVLEGSKYDVKDVADGQEAIDSMRREIPRLIVCDLMMPNVDGAKLVEHVRSENRLKHVPILILTIISDKEKEYSLLDMGADDYCEKTIQRKTLLKRIDNLIKRTAPLY